MKIRNLLINGFFIVVVGTTMFLSSCKKEESSTVEAAEINMGSKELESYDEVSHSGKEFISDKPFISRDELRADEITAAYSTKSTLKSGGEIPPIIDLYVSIRDQDNAPQMLGQYEKIPVDLNKGAGGKWIYLYFLRDKSLSGVYTMGEYLTFIEGYNNHFQALGQRAWTSTLWNGRIVERNWLPDLDITADLNDGCGINSHYVYLSEIIKKNASYEEAIKNIKVIASSQDNQTLPSGYTKVNLDLNKNAGGDFIYVYYTKENL
jgi:hypothetical protein